MEQEWVTDEIEAVVSGFFSTHHCLQTAAGIMGELSLSPTRTNGVFRFADGRELVMKRPSWWKRQYELWENGVLSGSSHPRSLFRREIVVQFGGKEFALRPAGFWTRRWHLIDDAGRALLEIRPRGVFRRGAFLTILDAVDVALLIFGYYLVYARWREEAAAAAAAS